MTLRNSLKSIVRTPVKTLLYILLITAVTAFLYLGANTWSSSAQMLRDLDQNFTSIVTFSTRDTFGSSEGYTSDDLKEEIAGIPFDQITGDPRVLDWQAADVVMGTVDGYVSAIRDPNYSSPVLFLVTGVRPYAEDNPLAGKLVDTLYSYQHYEPGRTLFLSRFDLQPGEAIDREATYLIHAKNDRQNANGLAVEIVPFYSWDAEAAGVDTSEIQPILKIDSVEDFLADEGNIYHQIADYYRALGRTLRVNRVQDLASKKEFHQNFLQAVEGRLYTPEEAAEGKKLAVISDALARRRELSVGDSFTLFTPEEEGQGFSLWGAKLNHEEVYEVVGILNYHEDYYDDIYIPAEETTVRPVNYVSELGQAVIKNGTAQAYIEDIQALLPENVQVNYYDQGYQDIADSLQLVQNAAIALSLIAFAVTLAVLAFFAFLYAETQQETVGIMRSFGETRLESRCYLLSGACLIALVSIGLGIVIGLQYAEDLLYQALHFVSDLMFVDYRYSDGYRGLVKPFTPVFELSYGFALAVGVGIFVLAILFSLFFSEQTISGRLLTHRVKVHVAKAPKTSSTAGRGSLRHAGLAARRSSTRSLVSIVLAVVTILFISSMDTTLASYREAKDRLYEETTLIGYTAKMDGGFTDRMVVANPYAKLLQDLDGISDVNFTYSLNYRYLGIATYADGTEGPAGNMPVIESSFQMENLYTTMPLEPDLVFTDHVAKAPEFYFTEHEASYMEGWDEARFASREWDILPALVSDDFLSSHGISYGDQIRVYTQDNFYGGGYMIFS